MKADRPVRVLVVDDSAVARDLIARGLSTSGGIEVVGKASDAWSARDKIVFQSPDVVTLDVQMPGMDGIEFLRRLIPQYPLPVVVVSSVTGEGSARAMEALAAGAVAVVPKPSSNDAAGLAGMISELADAIREASLADVTKAAPSASRGIGGGIERRTAGASTRPAFPDGERGIIAIGASTGGTNALAEIIPLFPPDMPGTVIVQHMPPVFTRLFAESLNRSSRVEVREARDGDVVRRGLVLVAPGDFHLRVATAGDSWKASLSGGEKVNGHRPSVDVLFESVARAAGESAVGVLLTGMGKDGAAGLLSMRKAGARCLAQDEETSVVFGMPKEAWKIGAAERLVAAGDMARAVVSCLSRAKAAAGAGKEA